ncbi:hypothetical protein HYQ45_005015 [Verticillium longisporum]|uniref:Fungal N-terminal domain-containing protein n=1 Tax=Verticillium longisporum TaxID=100787 RepID=A0A8I3ATV3_VERLO|nr:hypothetical protein HYQ45_005015 [Verticillium longisporum]
MAEAFAILGVVGVGLQIAKEFIRLSDSFSALSHASEDCQYFALSSKNMSAVITSLFTAARRSLEVIETDQRPEREATLDGLIKEFGQVQLRLRDLAIDTRIDEQHLGSNDSYFVRLTFSWRWYRKKAAVTMSRMMQETTKSTANLFISTMLCEDLMRQIRVLQETKTDSKDLQSLNNQVKFLSEQIVNQRRDWLAPSRLFLQQSDEAKQRDSRETSTAPPLESCIRTTSI